MFSGAQRQLEKFRWSTPVNTGLVQGDDGGLQAPVRGGSNSLIQLNALPVVVLGIRPIEVVDVNDQKRNKKIQR